MKSALVTGASRGIGRAVTEMLLADGWYVFGVSRTDPGITGRAFGWWEADISHPHQVERLIKIGYVDAVMHCAAIRGPHGMFDANDPDEWIETIKTNLLGAYYVSRLAAHLMCGTEDGRLLLFSGGGAFGPSPSYSSYAVAKAGVVSLMETMAEETRGTTLTVNCVAPGPIPTTIHPSDDMLPDDGGAGMATAVACVRHLLSPAARGLTGKTISAVHDDWTHLSQWNVDALNASTAGTRTRNPIAMLQRLTLVG